MKKIGVSYLGVKSVPKTLIELDKTDADYIHVDVMDGKYTKYKTVGFNEMTIGKYTQKRLDVHLMVRKPLKYIDDFALLNVSRINVHVDIKNDLEDVIDRIKIYGIKVGLVLNPDQDIDLIEEYLDRIDNILVMTVVPGLPGQELIPETVKKLNTIKKIIDKAKLPITLEVDGGVNLDNIKTLKNADIIVSGSCITKSDNFQETIDKLRK
jgi:ribulose-phosphate 3-epimerase